MQSPEAECRWHVGGRGRVAGPERFAQELLEQVMLKAPARHAHVRASRTVKVT